MSARALLTAREVAERLHYSTETILRWVRRGQLVGIRMPGGELRFREDALDAWLEDRATPRRGLPSTTTGAARIRTLPSIEPSTTNDEV